MSNYKIPKKLLEFELQQLLDMRDIHNAMMSASVPASTVPILIELRKIRQMDEQNHLLRKISEKLDAMVTIPSANIRDLSSEVRVSVPAKDSSG